MFDDTLGNYCHTAPQHLQSASCFVDNMSNVNLGLKTLKFVSHKSKRFQFIFLKPSEHGFSNILVLIYCNLNCASLTK